MHSSRFLIMLVAMVATACASVRAKPVEPWQPRPRQAHLTVYDESGQEYVVQAREDSADPELKEALQTLAAINGGDGSPCLYLPSVGTLETAPTLEAKVKALAKQLEDSKGQFDSELNELRELFVALHAAQPDDRTRRSLLQVAAKSYPKTLRGMSARQMAYVLADYSTDKARGNALRTLWEHTNIGKTSARTFSPPDFSKSDAQAVLAAFSTEVGKARAYALIRERVEEDFYSLSKPGNAARKALDDEVYVALRPALVRPVPKGADAAARIAIARTKVGILTAAPDAVRSKIDAKTRDMILTSLSHPETQQQWVKAYAALVTAR